jgi:Acetyltransferase (GNAT) domain
LQPLPARTRGEADMTVLTVSTSVDPAAWDRAIESLGGSVFHTAVWAEYQCHGASAEPLFFEWKVPGSAEPQALALGIRRRAPSAVGFLGRWVQFQSPPARLGGTADLVESVGQWARSEQRLAEVQLQSLDERMGWSHRTLPCATTRYEFVLEASTDLDVLQGMRPRARRYAKAAKKDGVEVRPGEPVDIPRFSELFEEMQRRLHRKKGVRIGGAARLPALERLVRSDHARLYVAEYRGQTVAGWLFTTFAGAAYSYLGASTDEAVEMGAVRLALVEALQDLAASGFERLNLGGVSGGAADPGSPDHGLYEFKRGFGARPILCTNGRIVLRPWRLGAIGAARGALGVARRWR